MTERGYREPVGRIFNIQKYSLYDGKGVRTLAFFKGCPMKCIWCANPESQSRDTEILLMRSLCTGCGTCETVCPEDIHSISMENGELSHGVDRDKECTGCLICESRCPSKAISICGREMTLDDVMRVVMQDEMFYMTSGGGVTLGGGEVTQQHTFAVELLKRCKGHGINTAIETCGYTNWEVIKEFVPVTDVFLYDLKALDTDIHRKLTGCGNEPILSNLRKLLESGARVTVRMPLVKGMNDSPDMLRRTAEFLKEISPDRRLEGVDILPYHRLGLSKYDELDRKYGMDADPSLSDEDISTIKNIMASSGLPVRIVRH